MATKRSTQVVAVSTFAATLGKDTVMVVAGAEYPSNDPVVKAHPDAFEKD